MKKFIMLAVMMFALSVVCSAVTTPKYFGAINTSTSSVVSGTSLIQDVGLTNGTTIAIMVNLRSNPSLTSKGTYIRTVIVPATTTQGYSVGNISLKDFVVELSTTTDTTGVTTTGLIVGTVWYDK